MQMPRIVWHNYNIGVCVCGAHAELFCSIFSLMLSLVHVHHICTLNLYQLVSKFIRYIIMCVGEANS